uniref:Uncharacterized protein n=1 Tax=Myoviridae sp. ct9MV2 TaxID=2826625 RepID=A0A8S5NDJ9_9CAUD|nr:MAG TPA: Protein of unknown function (DUF1043) [Myoviridae sp. ct9MV2]
MSINETLIIVVIALCITYLISIYNKRQLKTSRRLLRIISKLRKENCELRQQVDECYTEWFKEFEHRQKTLDEVLNKIYDLSINKENK